MRKFKYLLLILLVAMLTVGTMAACSRDVQWDLSDTPILITYCANGGVFGNVSEQYEYVKADSFAPGPDNSGVVNPTRAGYRFVGWAKGGVNEEGKPVLLAEPKYPADGGVYTNRFGALTQSQAETESTNKPYKHEYYDYDQDDLWNFEKDIVKKNVVLVAVWAEYDKFIIADKDENGDWVNYEDFDKDSDLYNEYEENSLLHNVTSNNGSRIEESQAKNAYKSDRPDNTLIKFYYDEECKNEVSWPYFIEPGKLTVLYYEELDDVYDIVNSTAGFQNALLLGNNMYIVEDLDFTDVAYTVHANTYSGKIVGNNHKISNVKVTVTQTRVEVGKQSIYGGFFGDLNETQISDLDIEVRVNFVIAVDPYNNRVGSIRDAICYVGMFAKSMSHCSVTNVRFTAEYEVTRSKVSGDLYIDPETGKLVSDQYDNDYKVDVVISDWQSRPSASTIVYDDCDIFVTAIIAE